MILKKNLFYTSWRTIVSGCTYSPVTTICLFWKNKRSKVTSWISFCLSEEITTDEIRNHARYNQKHTSVSKLGQSFNAGTLTCLFQNTSTGRRMVLRLSCVEGLSQLLNQGTFFLVVAGMGSNPNRGRVCLLTYIL